MPRGKKTNTISSSDGDSFVSRISADALEPRNDEDIVFNSSSDRNITIGHQFSTLRLWQLRLYICGKMEFAPLFLIESSMYEKMRELRGVATAYINSSRSSSRGETTPPRTDFCSIFFDLWKLQSTLHTNHPLYVPPLFLGSEVDDVIEGIAQINLSKSKKTTQKSRNDLQQLLRAGINGLKVRETSTLCSDDSNVGHMLLAGQRGVGKTLLLRALAFGAAILLDRMVPLVWSYEKADWEEKADYYPTPSQLIYEWQQYHGGALESVIQNTGSASISDLVNLFELEQKKARSQAITEILPYQVVKSLPPCSNGRMLHQPFFCLDEFQSLFVSARNELAYPVCKVLQNLCRHASTFALITGSTTNMKKYLFYPDNSDHISKNFPDFNHTLFTHHIITPMRSTELLGEYIRKRYPWWVLTERQLQLLLYYTGGVGRAVNEVALNLVFSDNPPTIKILPSDEVMKNTCKLKLLDFRFDQVAKLIFALFQQIHGDKLQRTDEFVPHCLRVRMKTVLPALVSAGVTKPVPVVENLVDRGIFHLADAEYLELGRPADIEDYDKYMNAALPTDREEISLVLVKFMVEGIIDSQTGQSINNNSGTILEKLVARRLPKKLKFYVQEKFETVWRLSVSQGIPYVQLTYSVNNDKVRKKKLSLELLREMSGARVEWARETGIDGIVFELQEKNLILHCWQVKDGKDTSFIEDSDTLKSEFDRYMEKRTVSDRTASTMAHILFNGYVGIQLLMNMFIKVKLPINVIKVHFTLVTNKSTPSSKWTNAQAQRDKYISSVSTSHPLYEALKTDVELHCLSGYRWIYDCLSEELQNHTSSEWLTEYETRRQNKINQWTV